MESRRRRQPEEVDRRRAVGAGDVAAAQNEADAEAASARTCGGGENRVERVEQRIVAGGEQSLDLCLRVDGVVGDGVTDFVQRGQVRGKDFEVLGEKKVPPGIEPLDRGDRLRAREERPSSAPRGCSRVRMRWSSAATAAERTRPGDETEMPVRCRPSSQHAPGMATPAYGRQSRGRKVERETLLIHLGCLAEMTACAKLVDSRAGDARSQRPIGTGKEREDPAEPAARAPASASATPILRRRREATMAIAGPGRNRSEKDEQRDGILERDESQRGNVSQGRPEAWRIPRQEESAAPMKRPRFSEGESRRQAKHDGEQCKRADVAARPEVEVLGRGRAVRSSSPRSGVPRIPGRISEITAQSRKGCAICGRSTPA